MAFSQRNCGNLISLQPSSILIIRAFLKNSSIFGANSKTKHIDIKCKSLREKFKTKDIDVKLVLSKDMLADSLTNAAPHSSLQKLQDVCFAAFSSSSKGGC
jgi:hypothetical protein